MAYRSSSSNAGNSTTPSTPVPAGVAADDIVILTAEFDNVTAAFDPADWPTGFTELNESDTTFDGNTAAIGWKRLTGADAGSYTFGAVDAGAHDWVCQAYAFSGRHVTNPPTLSTNLVNTGAVSPRTISASTVTAVAGDDLLWVSAPDVNATGIGNGHTAPAGYTKRQDQELAWANLSGATVDAVGAGATGTVSGSFAMTSGQCAYVAWLVRIPVAGGASPVTHFLSSTGVGT